MKRKNRVTFMVDDTTKRELDKVAKENGLSKAEIIRRGVIDQIEDLEG